jgi:hypothetical protein
MAPRILSYLEKLRRKRDANATDSSVVSGTPSLALVQTSIPDEDVSRSSQTSHVLAETESGSHEQFTSPLIETTIPAVHPSPHTASFA